MIKFNEKEIKRIFASLGLGATIVLTGCGSEVNRAALNDNFTDTISTTDGEMTTTENAKDVQSIINNYYNYNYYCECDCKCNCGGSVTTVATTVPTVSVTTTTTAKGNEDEITTSPVTTTTSTTATNTTTSTSTTTSTTSTAATTTTTTQTTPSTKAYTYNYVDTFAEYKIQSGDTLTRISVKISTPISLLKELNNIEDENDIKAGASIKYPAKYEYVNVGAGEQIASIAVLTGVDEEIIRELNNISDDVKTLDSDSSLLIHIFNGTEDSYKSNIGIVNPIRGHRIIGDKIIQATGFTGASNKMFVLENSVYEHGINNLYEYTFDGNDSCSSKLICHNVKDITWMDGVPVAYFRTYDDIVSIAEEVNVVLTEDEIDFWSTSNYSGYSENIDENGNTFIAYGGMVFENPKTLVR